MSKVYGTESATPTVKPMTQPSVITSGEAVITKFIKKTTKKEKLEKSE